MHKSTEEAILLNSRLTVIYSCYIPAVLASLIISSVYFVAPMSFNNIFFGFVWIVMSILAFRIMEKKVKRIRSKCDGC